ncbi:polynucleotidyl transferase [Striga asiatica]|uniref:Polynucleotidyl transferase n=1 Tax=Striga asiatica TaxID=4170 RepID=A0A5A7P136_STRAF|nr:polynucleotidyl transferase [Striga asiatica]
MVPSLASVVRIWNPSLTFSSSAQLPQQYGPISTLSPLSPKYPLTAFKPLSPTGSVLGLASPIYSTSFPFLSFGTSGVPAMTKELNKSPSLLNASAIDFTHIYREGNSAADYLAGFACRARDFVLYDVADLPGPLRGIIRMDLEYPSIRHPHDDIRPQG